LFLVTWLVLLRVFCYLYDRNGKRKDTPIFVGRASDCHQGQTPPPSWSVAVKRSVLPDCTLCAARRRLRHLAWNLCYRQETNTAATEMAPA